MSGSAITAKRKRGEAGMEGIRAVDKEQLLEAMIDEYSQNILRMCYILLEDEQLAQDAMQDCFIKAWKSLDHFKGDSKLKTWLMRIAINTCKDYQKTNWFKMVDRRQSLETLPQLHTPPLEVDDTLLEAVFHLPKREKEAIMLCYYQGLSITEAAKALHVVPSTVHRRVKNAQKKLKIQLKEWYSYE